MAVEPEWKNTYSSSKDYREVNKGHSNHEKHEKKNEINIAQSDHMTREFAATKDILGKAATITSSLSKRAVSSLLSFKCWSRGNFCT